jgi:hypothetical protein
MNHAQTEDWHIKPKIDDQESKHVIDNAEYILQILAGQNRNISIFTLMTCVGMLCLQRQAGLEGNTYTYHKISKGLVSNVLEEIFSDWGLKNIVVLREVLEDRSARRENHKKKH